MKLSVNQVHRTDKNYKKINALKNRAFPKIEQVPGWLLLLLAMRKSVNYRSFYDENEFCGLLYTVETERAVFVLFLAVNESLRSKGYGSTILTWLTEQSAGKMICLNIEDPYEEATNNEQRKRRLQFYLRNGFTKTGWQHDEKGEGYLILCNKQPFSPEDYLETMKVIGCGFYHAKIHKCGSKDEGTR